MLSLLRRLVGAHTARNAADEFDPLYGLSKRSLDDWLSFNPQMRAEYESKLNARSLRARDGGSITPARSRRMFSASCPVNERIDVASEDSFPASDAPAWTPGIAEIAPKDDDEVTRRI